MRRSSSHVALMLLALAGCDSAPPAGKTMPVELHGELRLPAGAEGPVHVAIYHAWSGKGELRHPLEFIAAFTATAGSYRHTFAYPVGEGEGLVVYAWADLDGDGVLCTPVYRLDPAGLAEAKAFPAESVAVDVEMTAPCRGPDWFYPPAAAGT